MPETDFVALLIKAKDDEIARLIKEKELLLEKLCPSRNKPAGEIKKQLILDPKTKVLREKTDVELSEEFQALKDMGIV